MSTTNHADFEALCAAFALGALDGADRDTLRAHLPTCGACRQRVAEFEESSSWLALGLAPIQPSDEVKSAVMQRISGPHGQARPGAGRAPAGPSAPSAPAGSPSAPSSSPIVYVALAVAGLALAGAAAVGILYSQVTTQVEQTLIERDALSSERDALRTQVLAVEASASAAAEDHREERARLQAMIDNKVTELENARVELASAEQELQRFRRLLEDVDTRVVDLAAASPAAGQARGRVLWNDRDLVFVAEGLPPLNGQTYQLWAITPGRNPQSAGLYSDLRDGATLDLHQLQAHPGDVAKFAVSIEPTGGSPNPDGPTGDVLLINP